MIKKIWCVCVLLGFLFLAPQYAAAAATYRITEAELTTLENNLTKLEQICRTSRTESEALEKQLVELRTELNELETRSKTQQKLLTTANESLERYANEVKRKTRIIKRQRAFAYVLAAGVVAIAITK